MVVRREVRMLKRAGEFLKISIGGLVLRWIIQLFISLFGGSTVIVTNEKNA